MGLLRDIVAHTTGIPIAGSYKDKSKTEPTRLRAFTGKEALRSMQSERGQSSPQTQQPSPDPDPDPAKPRSRRTVPTGNPTIDIPLWFISPPLLNPFKSRALYEDEL